MAVTYRSRPSRLERWLEGKTSSRIIDFGVIPLLLILALLLPPISVPERVANLGTTRIGEAGGVIADPDGTQVIFLPGAAARPFRTTLASVPRVEFLAGSAGTELAEAARAIPSRLVAKSPFYYLKLRGEPPSQSTWVVPIPNDSEPYETLDIYTWDAVARRWQWLPHTIIMEDDQIESRTNALPLSVMVFQTNPEPAVASADLALAGRLPAEARSALAEIHPTGLFLGSNGGLDGALDATFDQAGGVYAVMPVIRNYDGPIVRTDLLANMLVDTGQRAAHVDALVSLVVGNLYAGVDIDYRGLDKNLRGEFNQFVKELADKLHAQGKSLGVRVEPPTQVAEDRWDTGPYDWQTLGMIADKVKIPAPVDPRAYIPGGQFDALLRYAVGQVDRTRLQIVFSGRSVEQAGNYLLQKSYDDALQPLIGRVAADQTVVEPGKPLNLALVSSRPTSGLVYDPNIGTYVYRYQDDQGNARTVWLENAASLSHKLEILKRYNLQGFTVENLPADGADADLWPLIRDFQQGRVRPFQSEFLVEYTIKTSDGQAVSQVRPLGDPRIVLAAPNEAVTLQIEAAIKDRGQLVAQAQPGPAVAVATYTPVPTPTPQFTPTPTPSPTPEFAELTARANANVRSGPGTDYPQIGQLRAGATYRITGRDEGGNWWQFSYDGREGWVFGDLVTVSGNAQAIAIVQAAPPPTPAPPPARGGSAPAANPSFPAAGGRYGFDYGVQAQVYGGADLGFVVNATRGMGFNWVKFQVPWKDFEGSKGAYGWGGMDYIVDTLSGGGLKILASIVKSPNWARPGNTDLSVEGPPANNQDYADFVAAYAARYKGRVQAIEVWNEQNLWYEWGNEPLDVGRYVDLLCRAYRAIKAADPNMIVVAGALTPTGVNDGRIAIDDVVYLQRMYAAGAKNCFDALGAHPSGYNNPPDAKMGYTNPAEPSFKNHPSFFFRETMERYRAVMVANGDTAKRIWPTEFGWASEPNPVPGYEYARDVTLDEQAQYFVRAYQMMKGWGWVGPAFLWNLNFNITNPGTELAAFGIAGRPAYSALQSMPK
ncbi:MAG: SH3 domain-containing protein [Anaerolineae bacterium]